MEARNRSLEQWFERIRSRQISLPRFQRLEAWGSNEIASLLQTVLDELPAGAVLVLEVGDSMPFVSRPIAGAPQDGDRVTELLLDGQQRLTALWRSLHDQYDERTYFVHFASDPLATPSGMGDYQVVGLSRWRRKDQRYPLWADNPRECWQRLYLPMRLLQPGDQKQEVDEWLRALDFHDSSDLLRMDRMIQDLRQRTRSFQLPFLCLPSTTKREVALDVFINVNTRAVRLTTFDILVAQVEAASGESLRDLVGYVLDVAPHAAEYKSVENLVLDTAAMIQNKPPSQAGYWSLDIQLMIAEWATLAQSVADMVSFMEDQKIFDGQRLPTDAPLAVIAALSPVLPTSPDELGYARQLLRRYLWRAFFTGRYEQAAATAAFNDFRALSAVLEGRGSPDDVPVLGANYALPEVEEIVQAGWPKNRGILARGTLALATYFGARDIADDAVATRDHVKRREYHHVFPAALLREAGLADSEIFRAMNCALITWRTNRTLASKEPMTYLKERADASAIGEDVLAARLRSHLIPIDTLRVGGYGALTSPSAREQIVRDYRSFMLQRAQVVRRAMIELTTGQPVELTSVLPQ